MDERVVRYLDPERPIRVGLVGFGYVAKTFHLPLLKATQGFSVDVVSSRRSAEAGAILPQGVAVLPDAVSIITSDAVDLVVICTPNETHFPFAEAALRAGKHVVVDKPFTLTLADARRLTAIAAETGRLLSVFQNRRWDSDFLTVRRAIEDGSLGEIVRFESRFDRFRPQVRDVWRESDRPGSGLLYDLGPHLIDQALLLFGVPDSIQATLARQRPQARVTDYFHILLTYGEHVVTLEAGMLVSGGTARFIVHGDRASLLKQKLDIQEEQLRTGVIPGSSGWGADPDNGILYEGASGKTRTVAATPGDQRGYYQALLQAMHGRGPNPVSPEQAVSVMSIIEAAQQSHQEGRRISPDVTEKERAAWVNRT